MAIELSEKQLKNGWQVVKFGEIAKEVKSTTKDPAKDGLEFYVGLEHLDPQSLRIARKGIIAEDNPSFTRRFSAGQILFGKRRCYQKKAAVADFEGICSGDIIVMDAIPKKIIPGLLPFIIQSDAFFDWAEKTSSGSLSPRTKWKSLAEFEFPLPPIKRQKEILEVLEKLEEVEQKTKEIINSLNVLLESAIVEQFNRKNGSVFLSDLCVEKRVLIQPPFDAQKKYVGFEHLEPVDIDIQSCGNISDVVSAKLEFEEGNILYGKIRPYLRKAAIAPFDGLCSSDLIVVEAKKNVSNVVVASILTSSRFAQIAMNSAKGTKMPRADWKTLLRTKIPETFQTKSNHLESVFLSIYSQKKLLQKKVKNITNIRNYVVSGEGAANELQ